MAIIVQSPLAAAANTAASFLQGQTEAGLRNRAAALAQQKQNSEDALQAAQAQMYLGHGQEFVAQGNQRDALTQPMVDRMEAQGYKLRADGNFENQKGEVILPAQAALLAAQTGLATANTGLTNAKTGLTNAQTKVALTGTLPFLQSKTAYTNSLPAYNNARVAAMIRGQDTRAASAAAATGARIQVAGMDEAGRMVLGQMVNDRIANGEDEKSAMDGALKQYAVESQAYFQQSAANNKATAAGQSQPFPNAAPPVMRQPNQSQGGVNLTLNLPSQNVGTGPNGIPTYNSAPAHSINLQGEVAALKAALNSPAHDPSKVQQIFNSRTDLTPQQKANIWGLASAQTPLPATSPGAFRVPLNAPTAKPSVGNSLFNIPQAPFALPGQ